MKGERGRGGGGRLESNEEHRKFYSNLSFRQTTYPVHLETETKQCCMRWEQSVWRKGLVGYKGRRVRKVSLRQGAGQRHEITVCVVLAGSDQ